MKRYRHIVIGCGGLGSAALYRLARRAKGAVLGLEQFALGHSNGGSQDHSRIIRHAYHSSDYGGMTHAAFDAWREVECESGLKLLWVTGGLDVALPGQGGEAALATYAEVMRASGTEFEELDGQTVKTQWPQWHNLDRDGTAIFQKDAGFVDAARANATHQALARAHGATIVTETEVRAIESRPDGVIVRTNTEQYGADSVVITVGSWLGLLAKRLGVRIPITVTREQVIYYSTPHLAEFAPDRFPIWAAHGDYLFYGFPIHGEVATKVAEDCGGQPIDMNQPRDFTADQANVAKLDAFVSRHLPHAKGPILYVKTCLYDMPPDRNFIIDWLPDYPNVIVGNGAGHAYKFAALFGEILADLAIDGKTPYPIAPFMIDRAAITDAEYAAEFHIG